MQTTERAILIRMPVELHEKLRELAERQERSVNAQVRYLVEQATKRGNR